MIKKIRFPGYVKSVIFEELLPKHSNDCIEMDFWGKAKHKVENIIYYFVD